VLFWVERRAIAGVILLGKMGRVEQETTSMGRAGADVEDCYED
jgi:hypothetical protein